MQRLLNLDVSIEPHGGGSYTCVAVSPSGGEARTDFELPFTDKDLQILVLSVLGSIGRTRRRARRIQSQERELLEDFGGQLFQAAFSGPVRSFLDRSLAAAESKNAGLRIRLRVPPELANIPWEYLYDRESAGFVSMSRETALVRYVEMPRPVRPFPVSPPLRILAMISAPSDVPELEGDDEWDKLTTALAGLTGQGMVQVDRLEAGTLAALQWPLLQHEYHVLHFVGHGMYDEDAQDGALALEGEDGRMRLVTGRDLGVMLRGNRSLRLVVLNACEGARSAQDDPFGGVAQALVRQGIPAVIAMQFEITDPAALVFSKSFYQAIAGGLPVDLAMVEARIAMFAAGNEVEWATPVLYLRSPDGQIFIKGRAPKAQEEADRHAREEADRQAKAEADQRAREEADQQAKAEADRKAQAQADRQAKAEADRKAQAQADRKAKAQADRKAKAQAQLEDLAERANTMGEAGDAAGARDQFAALVPRYEQILGPEHPQTLITRAGLAVYTGQAGDAAGARDQIALLVPMFEQVLGPEDETTLHVRVAFAAITVMAGDAVGARDQLAALVPVLERVLGPEHPDTLETRGLLATATAEAGDAAGARDQYAALVPVLQRVLGPEHPDTLEARRMLAEVERKAKAGAARQAKADHKAKPGVGRRAKPEPGRQATAEADRVKAETETLGAARLLADAERIAPSIRDKTQQARALADIAKALAATDPDHAARLLADAEPIARSIANKANRAIALADIAEVLTATDPDHAARLLADAERFARSVTDKTLNQWEGPLYEKVCAFARLAEVLLATDPDGATRLLAEAEHIAVSIRDSFNGARARAHLAVVLAATNPDRAERLARSIGADFTRAAALTDIAEALAATDPDRAAQLLAEAQRIARSFPSGRYYDPGISAKIARVLAASDPDGAESFAQSITDSTSKAGALRGIVKALAATDPDRAERLARSITKSWKSYPLADIAKAQAAVDPDRAERLAQSLTESYLKVTVLVAIAETR